VLTDVLSPVINQTGIPTASSQVRSVGCFASLRDARLAYGINALCWPRDLAGDFGEVVAALGPGEGLVPLDESRLQALALSPAGQVARAVMLADLRLLRDHGLAPELNCIYAYPRDEDPVVFPTDVYSWHADSAPIETATWLCTYHGAPSEGLPNAQARRQADDPAIRAELWRAYGGQDEAEFTAFLREHAYDLHYAASPDAQPWSFGVGHLWRIAVDWPGNPVPPCIHRAPPQPADPSPRLLLIS
jgi:hypothetical protein